MVGGGSKGALPAYSGRDSISHGRRGGGDLINHSYHDSSVASRRSNLSNSFMQRMSRNGLGDGGRYARDGGGGVGGGGRDRVGGPTHRMNGWADDDDSVSRRGKGYVVQVRNRGDEMYGFSSKRSHSSSCGGDMGKGSVESTGARKKG